MCAPLEPVEPGPFLRRRGVGWAAGVFLSVLLGACGGAPEPATAGLDAGASDVADAEPLDDVGGEPDAARDSSDPQDLPEMDLALDAPEADADVESEPDTTLSSGGWGDPIPIDSLPFVYMGDTRSAPSDTADRYACAPDTDESGPEYVFVFEPGASTRIRVSVDDVRGDDVDIDVHLLTGPSPGQCTARHDVALTALVEQTVYIAADTWVTGDGVERAGPFTLRVEEVEAPDPGDCLTNPIECSEADLPTPNGVPVEPAGQGGCPAGMAPVADFCVDRWEAALVTVDPEGPWTPFAPPEGVPVRAVSAPGLVPQGYVTQVQAAGACAEAGKRLCTDDEWLRACQGSAGTTFPYGASHEAGRCNEGRACHPVVQYFETGADWIWSELGHPCISQLPDTVAATGSHADCRSEDGIFDMHGNLHEWTANPSGIFRGGFYVDASINGPGCLYRTTAHSVRHWDYSTGFRCCAD